MSTGTEHVVTTEQRFMMEDITQFSGMVSWGGRLVQTIVQYRLSPDYRGHEGHV
jgi:hypothetical protein